MVRSELRYQYTWLSLQRYIEKKKNMAQFKKQGENFKNIYSFSNFKRDEMRKKMVRTKPMCSFDKLGIKKRAKLYS